MINSQEKQVLTLLAAILKELDLPMILVGAGARLLIFDRKFGEGRSTKDWDIAVSIKNWDGYKKLRETLINGDCPYFKSTQISHKFIHIETEIEVDIIPFGIIGEPVQQIIWVDSGNPMTMNVLGFTEALASAEIESIDGLEIQVINLPAFIVLKIFAWGDRWERTSKDLDDIEFVLSKYENDDRVYAELVDELVNEVVKFTDANIYLLGQDIYKILQAKTLIELNILLMKLIERFDFDDEKSLGYKLKVLQKGINSLSSIMRT